MPQRLVRRLPETTGRTLPRLLCHLQPPRHLATGDLVGSRVETQDRVICASPDCLRLHGEPQALADVRAHRCIVDMLKGPPLVWFMREGVVETRFSPPATHRFSDGEAMVAAAVGGLGLAPLPISLVRGTWPAGICSPFCPPLHRRVWTCMPSGPGNNS